MMAFVPTPGFVPLCCSSFSDDDDFAYSSSVSSSHSSLTDSRGDCSISELKLAFVAQKNKEKVVKNNE